MLDSGGRVNNGDIGGDDNQCSGGDGEGAMSITCDAFLIILDQY